MEFIDTSSNPKPKPSLKPQGMRAPGEEKRQTAEDAKAEAFMSAKTDNPLISREQMAEQLRKSKRQELISKRRYPALEEVSKEMEDPRPKNLRDATAGVSGTQRGTWRRPATTDADCRVVPEQPRMSIWATMPRIAVRDPAPQGHPTMTLRVAGERNLQKSSQTND